MTLSINAWLLGKIDEYKFSVRDATVDFYMAEAALRLECNIDHLKRYNSISLTMANLCLENGDDDSYLHALSKLHNRLIVEINNPQRCQLFRVQSYHFARHTLTLICQKYAMEGTGRRRTRFRRTSSNACRFSCKAKGSADRSPAETGGNQSMTAVVRREVQHSRSRASKISICHT